MYILEGKWDLKAVYYCLVFLFFLPVSLSHQKTSLFHNAVVTLSICEIQGNSISSPYVGAAVQTQGVVFADFDNTSMKGFFIQDEDCDGDNSSSDGIFIYLGEIVDAVDVGDFVDLMGEVKEYYGQTEIQVDISQINVLSHGNSLPEAVEVDPPFDNDDSTIYYESLESMYVSLPEALVIGPTDRYGRSWVVRDDIGVSRVLQDDPAGTGEIICVDDHGDYKIDPDVKTGDIVSGLLGPLQFSYGNFCFQLVVTPTVTVRNEQDENYIDNGDKWINVGTFNLENLFDTVNDPNTDDTVLSHTAYHRKLHKLASAIHDNLGEPSILAVQEVENSIVITDLISQPEIITQYGFVHFEGPDFRGIDPALLFDKAKYTLINAYNEQGCTTLVDGLGPDGNRDVEHPENLITCDTNNDGVLDGNRLFSRPPLIAHLATDTQSYQSEQKRSLFSESGEIEFWVIVNHWKSKLEDSKDTQYTLPRRSEQAEFVKNIVETIHLTYPDKEVIVLGDLNDFPDSQPLEILNDSGMDNLMLRIPRSERYTYIYQGVSQIMDHILVQEGGNWFPIWIIPIHINSDYPYRYITDETSVHRSSDHDPVLVMFAIGETKHFLPLIMKNTEE